jgi:hypothetical protein
MATVAEPRRVHRRDDERSRFGNLQQDDIAINAALSAAKPIGPSETWREN